MKPRAKSRFAVFFGNRGFFPASLQAAARSEVRQALEKLGHTALMLDAEATRHGAVETPEEGRRYARFLAEHRGQFDGVVVVLPNFGDETGAVAALQDAAVPILIQAYPDELTKMAPALRRDAFCGKFSIMDVFYQYGIKFTAIKPHAVSPGSAAFAGNIDYFDRVCRVVRGMRRMTVGAIGARTTAFKTVRIDELAMQRYGITMETLDLSDVLLRIEQTDAGSSAVKERLARLKDYSHWDNVPAQAIVDMARLSVVLDQIVAEFGLDALALRCWIEIQKKLHISACTVLSELNNRGVVAACEVDVGNAVTMYALSLASGDVATCLDWNNNYGEEENKCILFHCGPVPQDMMAGKGHVTDHLILANALGEDCSWGCNTGRIKPQPITFGSMVTQEGKLRFYVGEGRFTDDPIPGDYFGCAGVAEIARLQDVLLHVGRGGHRHHCSVTPGHVAAPVVEAFENYLDYEVTRV